MAGHPYNRAGATAQPVMEKPKIRLPPQNQNPWSNWNKIWHGWLRRRDDPSCKILCKSAQGGLLGK